MHTGGTRAVLDAQRSTRRDHRGVFDNPRLRLLIEDGLKFVADTSEKFDLIVLDLPDPV
jgi:spermidine synthase